MMPDSAGSGGEDTPVGEQSEDDVAGTTTMMSREDVNSRLQGIDMPDAYRRYYTSLANTTMHLFDVAASAKSKGGIDASDTIDPKIAFDLSDRVSKMHEIDIAEPLRVLLNDNSKEMSALMLAKEIALGKYQAEDTPLDERLDLAVRVGLAIVTEGATMAPLQGISGVSIRSNQDGTKYLSISIAGPMRSAGGTESAVTMLIADHVRKAAGLDKYQATSYDDEPGRFVEELRVYERDAHNFQYRVVDEDIEHVIRNLPVELDGVDTDNFEVVNHRNMKRIKTDKVRGGALRVLNDGLIGRSKKLLKRIERYELDGWEWLAELKGAIQSGNKGAGTGTGSGTDDEKVKEEDAGTKRMREVLTGRSVLSMAGRPGGFRLRYGRSCNTGFAAVGFHPVIAEILAHTITVGTQVKTDIPGKGASVAFVDSIDTPTVRLHNGSVVKVRDVKHGIAIRGDISEILHMGDVLISFGDFIENNAQLKPSGYVEEFWAGDLRRIMQEHQESRLKEFLAKKPTAAEAISLSQEFGVPLYPGYLYFWDELLPEELLLLLKPEKAPFEALITYQDDSNGKIKTALEKAGIPHVFEPDGGEGAAAADAKMGKGDIPSATDGQASEDEKDDAPRVYHGTITLRDDEALVLYHLLFGGGNNQRTVLECYEKNDSIKQKTVPDIISAASGITVRKKSSASVGIRIGRPEKAAAREMNPPSHLLFPIGEAGGATRDLVKAARENGTLQIEMLNMACPRCKTIATGTTCIDCGSRTVSARRCTRCREEAKTAQCDKCGRKTVLYAPLQYPLKTRLQQAQERLDIKAQEPLKGLKGLLGEDKAAESIEKGLVRQKFGLSVFKDGTVRFDATNSPLTHFRPSWIGMSVQRLRELGYTHDADGNELESTEQMVEMRMQDVIIPYESARYLLAGAKYIDMMLSRLYGSKPYYNAKTVEDMAGHLVIGLAPHTSVGVVGRIIGFTETHVCFATISWHSAKRRDADGDADSIMLLLDGLLNFSKRFLSSRIGGLMDAPLLIQPLVLPHELQPQAHNVEVVKEIPLEFFESTIREEKSADVKTVELVKSRLETRRQFYDYYYTHSTSTLTTSRSRSAYSVLGSMLNKLDLQLKNAEMIRAVDVNETVLNVIKTHLVPDMVGNLRAYATQKFRCTGCGKKYRRMPLVCKCTECGATLTPNITRSSVEKYLTLTKSLAKRYDIGAYHRGRIALLADELEMVFGKNQGGDQSMLSDYM